jgi:hypothetical protein
VWQPANPINNQTSTTIKSVFFITSPCVELAKPNAQAEFILLMADAIAIIFLNSG